MTMERFAETNQPAPPFMKENPYGYRVNIRNPVAAELWRRYRKKLGLPSWCPASDEERFEFESAAIPFLESRFHEAAPPVKLPTRMRGELPPVLLERAVGVGKNAFGFLLEKTKK